MQVYNISQSQYNGQYNLYTQKRIKYTPQTSFNGNLIPKSKANVYENFVYKTFISKYMTMRTKNQLSEIRDALKPFISQIKLKINKGEIFGWEINPNNCKKYVLFLHGAKGSSQLPPNQVFLEGVLNSGKYGIITPEYRGTGILNNEKFSIQSINEDSNATLEYLLKKGIKPEDITIVSHCLGAIPAVHIAQKEKNLQSLIMLSPFSDGNTIGSSILSKLHLPRVKVIEKLFNKTLKLFIPDNMDINDMLKNIKAPVSILYPENDNLITKDKITYISKKISNLRDFIIIPKSGHSLNKKNSNSIISLLIKQQENPNSL